MDMCRHLISEQRYQKISAIKSVHNKKASAAVYLLLRMLLSDVYGIDKPVSFDFFKKGKPYLKDYPEIHFNLSHSAIMAAAAVSDAPVGIDVQEIRGTADKLAKRVLTNSEYKMFNENPKPDDFFCKIWTIKESYLKKTGDGISKELRDINAVDIKDIKTCDFNGYYCSICGEDMQIKHIGRKDIEKYIGR